MAKHGRAHARRVKSKPSRPVEPAPRVEVVLRPPEPEPSANAVRQGHMEAVALYEDALAALQAHDFSRSSSLLRSVLSRYPEERELHERVRLYLNVCERHMTPRALSPSSPEERVYAATLAINAGNYEEALEHLGSATTEAPDHDHALYMLAYVLSVRGRVEEAVPLLLRAIALNPDNRVMARHDPDLAPLRQYDSVRAALEVATPAKSERRKAQRRR
jgi:tetratricopeptide (TPR) repeat protein